MNNFLENLLKILISKSSRRLIVPFYHMVSDDENTFAEYLYKPRKTADFKKDLEILKKYYNPISLEEFIKHSTSKNELKQNYFHVTFDDGLANFYKVVAPILLKEKISATIFINTDFVDNKSLFYRYKASLLYQLYQKSSQNQKIKFHDFFNQKKAIKEKLFSINYNNKEILDDLAKAVGYDFEKFLKEEKPYLTTIQIQELIEMGFTIGAHSKNHPLFADISFVEQVIQTKESINYLVEKFKLKYKVFSFPHTDLNVSKDFFETMYKDKVMDFSFGTSGIKKDRIKTNFQRIEFEIGHKKAEKYLMKEYSKYFFKFFFNKNIMPRN